MLMKMKHSFAPNIKKDPPETGQANQPIKLLSPNIF